MGFTAKQHKREQRASLDIRRTAACIAVATLVLAPFFAAASFVENETFSDVEAETYSLGARAASLAWARYVSERAHATRQFAAFWENSESVTLSEFRGYTASTMSDFPGLMRLTLVTTEGHIKWVAPPSLINEEAGALIDAAWAPAFRAIRVGEHASATDSLPVLSRLIPLAGNGDGHIIVAPLRNKPTSGLDGYVVAEIATASDPTITFSEAVMSSFAVEYSEDGVVRGRFGGDPPPGAPIVTSPVVAPANVRWLASGARIDAWPLPSTYAEATSGAPQALRGLGVIVAIVAGGTTWLAVARQRDRRDSQSAIAKSEARLRHANEMLAEKVRELDAFSRMVAHDLKAPLRGIAVAATALDEDYGKDMPSEAREHLLRIHGGATRLREMVDALLDYASVGGAAYPFARVSMGELVREALDDLSAMVSARKATVEVRGELPTLRAQRVPLKMVFEILIANALTHNPNPNPLVRIAAREVDREGEGPSWEISVDDNGPGVPPGETERIFELFHHGIRPGAGTGVGLATVRRIVEGQGGRAWVAPAESGGASFHFTIPRRTDVVPDGAPGGG